MSSFADRLQNAMFEKRMSQTELSELTGFSKASISQYLSGKNEPKFEKIQIIAEVVGVDANWLNSGSGSMTETSQIPEKITIDQAAKLMGKSRDFVRVGLQLGILPFGSAVKLSSRWTYYINPKRFYQYIGEVE